MKIDFSIINLIAFVFAVSSFILSLIFDYKILYLIGWFFVCIQIVCSIMGYKKEKK